MMNKKISDSKTEVIGEASGWNIDPKNLLEDPHVNPQLREAVRTALEKAKADGLFPRVGEVYRTPERSQSLHDTIQGPAASAWHSAHNYGLAIDVYLYDANNKLIDFNNRAQYPDWEKQVEDFAHKYMGQFAYGVKNDSGHFEYHPAFSKPLSGPKLENLRDQAREKAGGKTDYFSWIGNLWHLAGAEKQPSEAHPPDMGDPRDGRTLDQLLGPPDLPMTQKEINDLLKAAPGERSDAEVQAEKQRGMDALMKEIGAVEPKQSIQPPEVNKNIASLEVNQSIQPLEINQSSALPDSSYDAGSSDGGGYDRGYADAGGYDGGLDTGKASDGGGEGSSNLG